MQSEERQVVSCPMKGPMHIDGLPFNGVKDEVVLDNKVAVMKAGKFLLFRHSAKIRSERQQLEVLLHLAGKRFGCRGSVGRNIANDLCEVVFCNPEKLNPVLTPTHGYVFEGPS